jgi:hypothetical protein
VRIQLYEKARAGNNFGFRCQPVDDWGVVQTLSPGMSFDSHPGTVHPSASNGSAKRLANRTGQRETTRKTMRKRSCCAVGPSFFEVNFTEGRRACAFEAVQLDDLRNRWSGTGCRTHWTKKTGRELAGVNIGAGRAGACLAWFYRLQRSNSPSFAALSLRAACAKSCRIKCHSACPAGRWRRAGSTLRLHRRSRRRSCLPSFF